MDKIELSQEIFHRPAYLDNLKRIDPFALNFVVTDRATYYFLKRSMDFIVTVFALPLLLPLVVVIAVLIILDTGFPIFFTQDRVGAKRRVSRGHKYWRQTTFHCHKFRTMVQNADDTTHRTFIKNHINGHNLPDDANYHFKANDPRVTRVGRILRKASLDELPQLVNVLNGQMSLVGPRPLPPYEVAELSPWQRQRLAAQPGLTGLWQVSGRCEVPFKESIRMDIKYVHSCSLWLDFKILLRTVPAVISGRGAV